MAPANRFEAMHRLQDEALLRARETGPGNWEGDGLVMVAGGGRNFVNAYVSISVLRHVHGCTLPVQIWYLGPDEISPVMRQLLAPLDVELVDAFDVRTRHPMRRLGGWECKPFAVLHSPFERVLLLDADNVARRDPEHLFARPELAESGALFWQDIEKAKRRSPIWDLFRVPFSRVPEFESGQLVVDKRTTWLALHLATHYCSWSDIYWQYVNGDKQTFQMAWHFLGLPYALQPQRPDVLQGTLLTPRGDSRFGVAFEQYGFDNEPLFHHRISSEWVLYGRNVAVEGAADIESSCLPVLDQLRGLWDGRVMADPPKPSGIDGRDVMDTRRYFYRRFGMEERYLEFEPDGRIQPQTANEQGWHVETSDSDENLVISRADTELCRLAFDDDGRWSGKWLYYEQGPVELIPAGPDH